MPSRLRPTAPTAPDAILVGDPGRALLLAQELLSEPKMSNHARGLWGYSGETPAGRRLTIQATGMGGPSAALVVADLAELGVERAIRVGTCTSLTPDAPLGELLLVERAIAAGGSGSAFGLATGAATEPDTIMLQCLSGQARTATVASFDAPPEGAVPGADAADMQTASIFAQAGRLGVKSAALLVVSEAGDQKIEDEHLEAAAKRAGRIAAKVLSLTLN
jgi:uridine phosphorylase